MRERDMDDISWHPGCLPNRGGAQRGNRRRMRHRSGTSGFLGKQILRIAFFCLLTAPASETAGETPPAKESSVRQEIPVIAISAAEEDCGKCHRMETGDLKEAGGGHARLACTRCHADGHPPRNMEIIPPCSKCHEGIRHLECPACLPCHRNPHRPLDLILSRPHAYACLDCHPKPGEDLRNAPSAHSIYACTGCHKTHGQLQPCLECHRGHGEAAAADCKGCHPPHRPLNLEFDRAAETAICVSCHAEIGRKLRESQTRHRALSCATCHVDHTSRRASTAIRNPTRAACWPSFPKVGSVTAIHTFW